MKPTEGARWPVEGSIAVGIFERAREPVRSRILPRAGVLCCYRQKLGSRNVELTRSEIAHMIGQPEGPLVERKPPRVNAREIRQTVVAFANTVSGSDEAVLFIGVRDDGTVEGCGDTDAMQKTVRDVCDRQCYPAIAFRIEIFSEHRNVIAVVIPPSQNRPHFAGTAYVRRGSESVAAPDEVFNELVHSRNSKAGMLLEYKKRHTICRVIGLGYGLDEVMQCKVFECNAQYVRLDRIDGTRGMFSAPLENITIRRDEEKWCPEITVRAH